MCAKLGPCCGKLGPGKMGPWWGKLAPKIHKYSYTIEMIHKYSIIVGRILNISKTNIYIEEYFEVEIILLLLDMF